MNLSRREFFEVLAVASAAGFELAGCGGGATRPAASHPGAHPHRQPARPPSDPYEVPLFGRVSLLHYTDCHAQLLPVYYREPSVNIGVGAAAGRPPHLVGRELLERFGIARGSRAAHALTDVDFVAAARKFGKVGGFAHLATLVKRLRAERPGRTLLLDGGDTWQGSATALWTRGQDMVDAGKLLGVDMMTGHWEFTYGAERVREIVARDLRGHMEFLAHNVQDATWGEPVFQPYAIRDVGGVPVAVIGQAFPFTPIANPRHLIPDWTFGVQESQLQTTVDEVRDKRGAQVVVLLSHNGMDVDLKMASQVRGLDAILGGHTHDAVPAAVPVTNGGGQTLVIGSGSNGKFLSVLDLEVKSGRVVDHRYTLLPVFANLLAADPEMAAYIAKIRAPYRLQLERKLAVSEGVLYRRGNFNGTFDQVIVDALRIALDAEIAFSPGFRWGTTLLPGDEITMEHVLDQTAITYGATTLNEITGAGIKLILEDVADNLYHPDPYYQQGGDMVRVGGLSYSLDVTAPSGKRISAMRVGGKPVDPGKKYKVAGWASVQPQTEERPPVWDVVAEYLQSVKVVEPVEPYIPELQGVAGNPGFSSS